MLSFTWERIETAGDGPGCRSRHGLVGVLAGATSRWGLAFCDPLHPRHQCSPLTWDDRLDGLILHGGEMHHAGPQFDHTAVLRLASDEESQA